MKKVYVKVLFVVLLFCTSGKTLRAQCAAPPPPTVSGGTVAGCVSSASFTLTGAASGTNLIGWYANSFGGNALSTNSVFTTPTLTSGTTYWVGQSNASSFNDSLAMPTYSWNVPAQETRGYYFTAPHDFIITGLRVPVAIGGTLSGIAVVKLPSAPPLYASVTNSFTTLYLNQNITGTNIASVNIPVYSGDIIGVLGERGGYSAYGPNLGTGTYASTLGIGGAAVTLNRMGMLYNLATTAPQDLWTETVNTIGMVEMYVAKTCNSTLTPVSVSIVPVPQVIVAPPPTICANTPYTLSASGASTFTWTGGPQTSTYVVAPSTTTTYSVQGSILSNCTSTISTVTVSVDPAVPNLTATSSSSVVCSGDSLTLNGFGAPSFTWAGGVNSITNNVAFVPAATQQYTLYGSNSCGVSSKLITVTVNTTPVLMTTSTPTAVCDGKSATLTVTGAATYTWDEATAPGATFVVTPTISTSYGVSGLSAQGCPAKGLQVVVVVPIPTITIGAVLNKTLVCPGGTATLTSGGADIYSWNTGPQTSTNLVNPLSTQIYTVTGTNTVTQCSAINTIAVNVFNPTLTISSDTTVCKGATITLSANAGPGSTYLWSNGSPLSYINMTASVSASYSVSALTSTINNIKCTSTGSVMVTLHPEPNVKIVSTRTLICKGEKTILTASGGTAFTWTNLTPTTATVQVNPNLVNLTTTYTVTAIDLNGCPGTATIGVKVNACTAVDELEKQEDLFTVYPNPNNGTFIVQAKTGMPLTLVNELGQEVMKLNFTKENQYQQRIETLSAGVYFLKGIDNGAPVIYKILVTR